MVEAGWLGIAMPAEFGGSGLGITEAAVMMQAVAESGACMSGASSIHLPVFGLQPVVLFGTQAQKQRMLPPVVSGEHRVCFAVTEPNAGLNTTELKTRADRRGYLVLEGRAGEFEDDRPYSLFVDALDDYLATRDRQFTPSNGDSDDPLRAVFPALAHRSPPPTTLLDERFRIHRSLRAMLEQLARASPLVILLDDVHWADGASIDALTCVPQLSA